MKTSTTFSMMLIGMMMLGTTTSFGKTNTKPVNNPKPRMEMRSDRNHEMRPEKDRHMDKPIPPHRHEFGGPDHKCRVCHMTEHTIHDMERGMHNTPVKPMPRH